jgi:hypothetical protein
MTRRTDNQRLYKVEYHLRLDEPGAAPSADKSSEEQQPQQPPMAKWDLTYNID